VYLPARLSAVELWDEVPVDTTLMSSCEGFRKLSKQIQKQARKACRIFQDDPKRPSLRFKKVHPTKPIYSPLSEEDIEPLAFSTGMKLSGSG
jgi:hypothetical protein